MPLGCLLQDLFKLGLSDTVCPEHLISLCTKAWSQYVLNNGTRRPLKETLEFSILRDLENFACLEPSGQNSYVPMVSE